MYRISENLPELNHGGFCFKLEYCEPSEFSKAVAREELRETPENVANGLAELRKLLKEETNLSCPIDNDVWLLSFLRLAHFYPESALKKIRNYFNYQENFKEYYENLNLEMVKECLLDCNGTPLPQRDQNGRRICLVLSGKYWNHKKFSKDILLQMFLVQSYFLRPEPDTQICGIVIILDLLDLSLRQALRITPRFCKALVEFLQEGIGLRLKGYHVVNQSKIVDMLFAMTRPFIAEKYLKRIYFHGKDWSALHKHVSAECLPEAYGGTLKSAEQSYGPQFYELYKHYESDFERFAQYGYK